MSEVSNSVVLSARRHLPPALLNVVSNWAGVLCSSIIALFLSPFIVHHLGKTAYGILVLVGSLTGYLGLLNLGVRAAVTRYVARFHADANDQQASEVASTAMVIFLGTGTLAILISLTIAAFAPQLFHISNDYQFVVRLLLVLAGFNIAVSLIGGVFAGIVAALHRFDVSNVIEVANGAASAFAIFVALAIGKGLIAVAVINLTFAVTVGIAYAVVVSRLYPALKIRPKCDKEYLKPVLSLGIYGFLMQISFTLIFYTDSMVIGAFLSTSMITYFAIAGNLVNYSRMLISGISMTMTPRASALETRDSGEGVRNLLVKATRLSTLIILPIGFTFLLRGSSFIRLWMGQEYGNASGQVLRILSVALLFIAADQVLTAIMAGIDKHRPVALILSCEAVLNLALSIVLSRRIGIAGVAWGTTLPSLAVSLLFWPWYVHRVLGVPIRTYIVSTWLRPFLAAIPFALLTYGTERLWPARNLVEFFLQVAAILPSVVLSSWYLCLDIADKKVYAKRFMHPLIGNRLELRFFGL